MFFANLFKIALALTVYVMFMTAHDYIDHQKEIYNNNLKIDSMYEKMRDNPKSNKPCYRFDTSEEINECSKIEDIVEKNIYNIKNKIDNIKKEQEAFEIMMGFYIIALILFTFLICVYEEQNKNKEVKIIEKDNNIEQVKYIKQEKKTLFKFRYILILLGMYLVYKILKNRNKKRKIARKLKKAIK